MRGTTHVGWLPLSFVDPTRRVHLPSSMYDHTGGCRTPGTRTGLFSLAAVAEKEVISAEDKLFVDSGHSSCSSEIVSRDMLAYTGQMRR